MSNLLKIQVYILFTALAHFCLGVENSRQKRTLLFPPTSPTRTQFIAGIGIPVEDLAFESLTTGYVFKAEYFLPSDVDHLKKFKPMNIGNLKLRKKREDFDRNSTAAEDSEEYAVDNLDTEDHFDLKSYARTHRPSSHNDLSKYRWSVYKGIEAVANRMGFVGRACMLRSICEVAETPFHYNGGILSELMHILMTPSSSSDDIVNHSDNEYFHAEILGKSGAACSRVFKECQRSLIDQFSGIFETTTSILNYLG